MGVICDDGDPCTDDACIRGECLNTGVPCDSGQTCIDGECVSEGTPTTVARVLDTSIDIGIIAAEDDGDKLAVFGDKDASGDITRIAGATYVDANGDSLTVWFGPDGLPERAVTGAGWVFAFSNYSGTTVDLTVTQADGTTTFHSGVPIDPDAAARLSGFARDGVTGPEAKARVLSRQIQGEITLSEGLEVAGLGMSFFGCAGDIATSLTVVWAPAGIPSAILSCSSFLLSIFSQLTGNEPAAEAASTLTTISCVIPTIGSLGSCAGVGLTAVGAVVEDAEEDYCAGDTDGDGPGDACDPTPLGGDTPPDLPDSLAVVNGGFDTDDSGWETSVHSGWVSDLGCDGLPGSCFVNSVINDVGWIQQSISGLTPSGVYRISGCYKTMFEWFGGPSFQAQIDGEVMFEGGFTRMDNWTPFEFDFVAAGADVMLRFESQVGGTDSDYVVDMIRLTLSR